MLTAVIFDFDGIIVDTEPIHFRAFQEVLNPMGLGYSWEEYLDLYIGFDDRDAFREVFRASGRALDDRMLADLIERKAEKFEQIVKLGVKAYPGVLELICSLAGRVPLALCSGALRRDIVPILGMLGIGEAFDVVITADDVEASKPDPESYALAVRRLAERFMDRSITPGTCLAVEDTPAGIESASAAGLKVLAVANSYEAGRLAGAAHVADSLEGMDLATLQAIAM